MTETRLRLTGPSAQGVRVSAQLLQATMEVLVGAVEESVRLRVEGRSRSRGSKPAWLSKAAAFEVELQRGSTAILLVAPPLAEVSPSQFSQSEMFEPLVGNLSCIDVFSESFAKIVYGDRDSDLYDDGLVETMLGFGKVLNLGVDSIELQNGKIHLLTPSILEQMRQLRQSIPSDQKVRIAGALDALRHSNRTFEIRIQEGEVVRGILASEAGEVAELGPRLGSNVVVTGTAKFRPSGRLLRLDADSIAPVEGDISLWSVPPRPLLAVLPTADLRYPQGSRSGASAIFGQWPGDESDEEVEALLRELS